MSGLSTIGIISLGLALVAGRKRLPMPATGNTALVTFFTRPILPISCAIPLRRRPQCRAYGPFPACFRLRCPRPRNPFGSTPTPPLSRRCARSSPWLPHPSVRPPRSASALLRLPHHSAGARSQLPYYFTIVLLREKLRQAFHQLRADAFEHRRQRSLPPVLPCRILLLSRLLPFRQLGPVGPEQAVERAEVPGEYPGDFLADARNSQRIDEARHSRVLRPGDGRDDVARRLLTHSIELRERGRVQGIQVCGTEAQG